MNCELNSMKEEQKIEDEVPRGRVGAVCKQWSVKEDGVLAYRLQNEEIEHHYEGNRTKSKIGRLDFHKAKHLQEDEEKILAIERRLFEQQLEDERIAKSVQEQIVREENEREAKLREEDEKMAKKLHEKEKEKMLRRRTKREQQQLEKIKLETGLAVNESAVVDEYSQSAQSSVKLDDYFNETDLSEFCMKPPPNLTPEELRQFLAEQDAEIALFLQQQEAKRSDVTTREKKMLVEAQDFEIARILQIEEKAKAKRLREKARLKNLQKQLREEVGTSVDDDEDEVVEESARNGNISVIEANSVESSKNIEADAARRALPPVPTFHNVAMDLDPTYKTNLSKSEVNLNHGLFYAQVYQVSPGNSTSSDSLSSSLRRRTLDVSPSSSQYLPVQGQKRSSSKNKKGRDGCKTH